MSPQWHLHLFRVSITRKNRAVKNRRKRSHRIVEARNARLVVSTREDSGAAVVNRASGTQTRVHGVALRRRCSHPVSPWDQSSLRVGSSCLSPLSCFFLFALAAGSILLLHRSTRKNPWRISLRLADGRKNKLRSTICSCSLILFCLP